MDAHHKLFKIDNAVVIFVINTKDMIVHFRSIFFRQCLQNRYQSVESWDWFYLAEFAK